MSPAANNADGPQAQPTYSYLYQRQRSRAKGLDTLQARNRIIPKHELGRRDRNGERVTRIYPRELTKSPPTATRYPPPHSPSAGPVTSPLLTALGSTSNTAAQYTSEWTKSLPFFAQQQNANNGLSVSGSPPNYAPSHAGRDGGYAPVSGSPPVGARPISHPNGYPNFGGRMQHSPSQRDRRASMYAYNNPQYSSRIPLPHQPQPHFFGVPEINIGPPPGRTEGLAPGDNGYFCGWDTLSAAGDRDSAGAENVLIVGYEGGLELYRVTRKNMDLIGQLEGLKGGVISAKILPATARGDVCSSMRPLIALIIHGPIIHEAKVDLSSSSSAVGSDEHGGSSESPTRPPSQSEPRPKITHYQTTVEVYSLTTRQHVATLYTSPPVEILHPIDSQLFKIPPPVGDLKIDANGKFIAVASGSSGEIFVFSSYYKSNVPPENPFRCIGKLWTTVTVRESGHPSAASSDVEGNSPNGEAPEKRGVALFSLSHRWIAIVPPASSSNFSLKGTALLQQTDAKPPGITTHMAPSQPLVTCAVDTSDGDTFLNRMSREVTQQVLKGAKWVGDRGMQAWNNYWTKPTSEGHPVVNGGAYEQQPNQYFPPTHAQASTQTKKEPALISVFDLQRFLDAEETKVKNALVPLATFEDDRGCSFVSFAPTGLHLLTVNRKGDCHYVWDLMRMIHTKAGPTAAVGSYVRQVALFTRLTPSNVVDVVWSTPKGEKLALLTERGTIHVHELPQSALQWPPPRRARKQKETADAAAQNNVEASPNKGRLSTAIGVINGGIANVRQRRPSNGTLIPTLKGLSITPAAGAKGGKAVITKGFGAASQTVNDYYHRDDSKLRLHSLENGVSSGCVRWLTGRKDRGYIGLVAGQTARIYPVKHTVNARKGRPSTHRTTISKRSPLEFELQPIPDSTFPPTIVTALDTKPGEDAPSASELTGIWTLRAPVASTAAAAMKRASRREKTIQTYAEMTTNPPYQPFHTDRRVNLFAYPDPMPNEGSVEIDPAELMATLHSVHHVSTTEPWVFGGEIVATKLMLGGGGARDDEFYGSDEEWGNAMGVKMSEDKIRQDGEIVEQVVVTTRRRRRREGEEGFFEDDCEVLDFADDRV